MAYTGAPSTRAIVASRALVGDVSTSTSATYLEDAEYTFFNSVTSNRYSAAQLAANSLAALFAGQAANSGITRKVGDLTLTKSDATQVAAGYRALGQELGRKSVATITPYAGGISDSDKSDVEGDSDRLRPAFMRRLFDNPQTFDFARAPTST